MLLSRSEDSKSFDCRVVTTRQWASLSANETRQNNSKPSLRSIFRRRRQVHDRMLVLNMVMFNFTDGWNRVFSNEHYARFSV